jgi:glucoamylase
MPKYAVLGNGSTLLCFDRFGQVRDLYYHYAGLENHVFKDFKHKIGVFVDDRLIWIDDPEFIVEVKSATDTMVNYVIAKNETRGIELSFEDVLYNEKNIFIRKVVVKNLFDHTRNIKLFFNQQFKIGQNLTGDTAYYEPIDNVIIHYKGRRVFLVNLICGKQKFDDYSVGIMGIEGKEGTYKDAEDGKLTKSPIEHGQVDSIISIDLSFDGNSEKSVYYWLTIGKSIRKTKTLNSYVLEKSPEYIIKSTKDYWYAWVHNQNFSFYGLGKELVDHFKRSLVTIRTHTNRNGSIIASGDSDLLQYGRDTYSYMWPRDSAISALALAKAGDFNASKRFFRFCRDIITKDGYFMHKYRPDKSLGSSWHPFIVNGEYQLPIQEDETALVINSLWTYYELSKDLEFIESIYNDLVKKAAEFMVSYIDEKTGLPKPSYDLWEMYFGVHTWTAATVYGALDVSSKFAKMLGKDESSRRYMDTALKLKEAIIKHLFDEKRGVFLKSIFSNESIENLTDKRIDMSAVYGVYKFGVMDKNDERLMKAFEETRRALRIETSVGGYARFEGDVYHFEGGNLPGNPWFITQLWNTEFDIEFIENEEQIADIVSKLNWSVKNALSSGMMSEQINPYTGEHMSAGPLIWSHAEYVVCVLKYLEKLEEVGICEMCYPVNNK